VLLDTGARPGDELLNLRWNQIKFRKDPISVKTGVFTEDGEDGDAEEIVINDLQRTVEMVVTGKTGTRTILGMQPTVKALTAIAKRNYNVNMPIIDPFKEVAVKLHRNLTH